MTRLHGSAVLGSVRLSLERGGLEPGPVGAPGTSTAFLVVSSSPRLPWARCADQPDLKFAPRTVPGQKRQIDPLPTLSHPQDEETSDRPQYMEQVA